MTIDPVVALSANDVFKAGFGPQLSKAILFATSLHFALLAFGPRIAVSHDVRHRPPLNGIEFPDEVKLPPPPEEVRRPAVPVVSHDLEIDPEQTISARTFAENPPTELPEPPRGTMEIGNDRFTPYEVAPEFRNRSEYLRALERRYPPNLRDAGIGGTVVLWVYVDERGEAQETQVVTSSGYPEMDSAAEGVMREVARFSPALNRDQRVAVWVQVPVTFASR
jgi:TonB family protein